MLSQHHNTLYLYHPERSAVPDNTTFFTFVILSEAPRIIIDLASDGREVEGSLYFFSSTAPPQGVLTLFAADSVEKRHSIAP